jgi:hypothetical protein
VQDHLDDYVMVTELTQALRSAGPRGPVGLLSVEGMVTEELCLAIHKAERTRPKSVEAVQLLQSARVVCDLRMALSDGKWDRVEVILASVVSMDAAALDVRVAVESVVPSEGKLASTVVGHSLLPLCQAEVKRVDDEVKYRRVVGALTVAVSSGGVSGVVGGLVLTSVRFDAVSAAVELAASLSCPTEQSRFLLKLAKLVLEVRRALAARDWDSVETFLLSSEDVIPSVGASHDAKQSAVHEIPAACAAEFALLHAEVTDRRVQERLRTALASGAPVGDIGHLHLGVVDVAGLEAALEFAVQRGAASFASKCLVATAAMIRGMRHSLLNGKWDVVAAIVDHVSRRADVEPQPLPSSPSVSLSSLWVLDLDIVETGVAPEAAKEFSLMCDELKNRNTILCLTSALQAGMAMGEVGELDASKVDVSALDWAISYAKRMEVQTLEASHLLTTAQVIRKLRASLVAGDWRRLEQVRVCSLLAYVDPLFLHHFMVALRFLWSPLPRVPSLRCSPRPKEKFLQIWLLVRSEPPRMSWTTGLSLLTCDLLCLPALFRFYMGSCTRGLWM